MDKFVPGPLLRLIDDAEPVVALQAFVFAWFASAMVVSIWSADAHRRKVRSSLRLSYARKHVPVSTRFRGLVGVICLTIVLIPAFYRVLLPGFQEETFSTLLIAGGYNGQYRKQALEHATVGPNPFDVHRVDRRLPRYTPIGRVSRDLGKELSGWEGEVREQRAAIDRRVDERTAEGRRSADDIRAGYRKFFARIGLLQIPKRYWPEFRNE